MSRLRIVRFAVVLFLLANNASAIVIGKPVEADHLPVSNTQTSNNSTDGFIAPPGTIPPSVTQDAISPSLLQDTGRVPPMALEMLAGNAVPQASTANLQLVGQISGATFAVAVQGNYAYIGVGPRLVVLNISNKASPVMVGQTNILPGFVEDVAVAGNYAYIADGSGLRVVNVANPNAPTEVGFIDTPGYAQSVTVSGNNAYIADQGSGLRIIDVASVSFVQPEAEMLFSAKT
jgi:hypothetical protein